MTLMDISELSSINQRVVCKLVEGLKAGLSLDVAYSHSLVLMYSEDPEAFVRYLLSLPASRHVGGYPRSCWLDPWQSKNHPRGWRPVYAKLIRSDFGGHLYEWMHERFWRVSPKLQRQLKVHGHLSNVMEMW